MKVKEALIPGSDGSGEVVSVGSKVTKWKAGDRVMPIFTQTQVSGPCSAEDRNNTLGGAIDGVLKQFGNFNQEGLVRIPDDMTDIEAACLPCAGVTAWNALNGLKGKELKKGEWVLTQGTGGVSIFALQVSTIRQWILGFSLMNRSPNLLEPM
jgi:NADPH:quinone reductase-like Zn-dependent oxidoreductase